MEAGLEDSALASSRTAQPFGLLHLGRRVRIPTKRAGASPLRPTVAHWPSRVRCCGQTWESNIPVWIWVHARARTPCAGARSTPEPESLHGALERQGRVGLAGPSGAAGNGSLLHAGRAGSASPELCP